jgi:muramoyltetrapeptide carboxypeptidase LdcA involved in peptidoglycan recycling
VNDVFTDREVRAIVTTRGGAGAYRIADSRLALPIGATAELDADASTVTFIRS